MRSILSGWEVDLTRWLKPFLDRLGHKARRQMRSAAIATCTALLLSCAFTAQAQEKVSDGVVKIGMIEVIVNNENEEIMLALLIWKQMPPRAAARSEIR